MLKINWTLGLVRQFTILQFVSSVTIEMIEILIVCHIFVFILLTFELLGLTQSHLSNGNIPTWSNYIVSRVHVSLVVLIPELHIKNILHLTVWTAKDLLNSKTIRDIIPMEASKLGIKTCFFFLAR